MKTHRAESLVCLGPGSKLSHLLSQERVNVANLMFVKSRGKWRVRWRAKKRGSDFIFAGSRVFFEKAQAVQFYAEIEAQERLVRSGEVAAAESLETVIADFYRHIERFTPRTQGHYRSVIEKFQASLPKSIVRVHQLEAAHIQEYLYRMRPRKNRTQNAHLTAIKSFCRFLSERFNTANVSSRIKMLPEDPPNARFLTEPEYRRVLRFAWPLARNRIIFLANTGLRASEFAALKPDALSPQTRHITIVGKGRKRRTIPLNRSARSVIPDLAIGSRRALHQQFWKVAHRAGIPPFGPHSLRHYFATQLLLKGVPVKKVSVLLGHKSVATTERIYAHILPTDLAHVTDVLDE